MAARLRPIDGEPQTRLKQVRLLTPTRIAILDAIRESPGISMGDVARAIGRHPSIVHDHLRYLRQARLVLVEPNGRRVALYAEGELSSKERVEARLGPGARVLELVRQGVASTGAIALELGISRHAARSQLKRLERMGQLRAVEVRVLVKRTKFLPVD